MTTGRLREYWHRLRKMEIPLHASHASFFIVLSGLPALTLLLSLLRYTALEARDLMELARGLLPEALETQMWQILEGADRNASRLVVSLSAALTLWSASRGMYGLLVGLNGVYGREEQRRWLQVRLVSVVYTLLFALVLVLTLALLVFGGTLRRWLEVQGIPGFAGLANLRFLAVVGLQTLIFTAMFMFLPAGGGSFRESLPGAVFGSLGWVIFSGGFSLYVEYFRGGGNLYGSVYGVVLGMLWLYMCVSIVFYGGALNRFLAEETG